MSVIYSETITTQLTANINHKKAVTVDRTRLWLHVGVGSGGQPFPCQADEVQAG